MQWVHVRLSKKQALECVCIVFFPALFDSLYRVGEKLGQGTFGSVFVGTRKSDGKKVDT